MVHVLVSSFDVAGVNHDCAEFHMFLFHDDCALVTETGTAEACTTSTEHVLYRPWPHACVRQRLCNTTSSIINISGQTRLQTRSGWSDF